MTGQTTIGILMSFSVESLCDINQLGEYYAGQSRYTAEQYCDFRYATNLQRFKYDPFTGEKIDWKKVKNLIKDGLI